MILKRAFLDLSFFNLYELWVLVIVELMIMIVVCSYHISNVVDQLCVHSDSECYTELI